MQFWKMHQHGNGKCQHVVRHDATNRAVFSQPFHGLRNRSCYQVTCLWRRIDGCTCVYQVVDHTQRSYFGEGEELRKGDIKFCVNLREFVQVCHLLAMQLVASVLSVIASTVVLRH